MELLDVDALVAEAKRLPALPMWFAGEYYRDSPVGLWQQEYGVYTEPEPMLGDESYRVGMEWLRGEGAIADWGCGSGYAKRFCPKGQRYIGIDGYLGPATTLIANLRTHDSIYANIFTRHTLEHNFRWQEVLENMLRHFTCHMALVTFLPLAPYTQLAKAQDKVPYLHLGKEAFMGLVKPYLMGSHAVNDEVVWFLEKQHA